MDDLRERLTFAQIWVMTGCARLAQTAREETSLSGLSKSALPLAAFIVLAALATSETRAQWRAPTPSQESPAAAAPPASGTSRGENFSAGKPPAQLFVSDCTGSGCHRGPQGLAKDRGQMGLASFLREHYTNSRESAAALAAYLAGVPADARAAKPTPEPRQPRAAARSEDAAKPEPRRQPGETGDARPETAKPAPAQKPPRGRQATVAPTPPPAAAPAPAPEPPAPPAPPPPPQWDIFD